MKYKQEKTTDELQTIALVRMTFSFVTERMQNKSYFHVFTYGIYTKN